MQSLPFTRRTYQRGGYLYIAVLFTTLIVVSVVTASISLSTSRSRANIDRVNRMSAVRLAESELHRVASLIDSGHDWRNTATNNVFEDWVVVDPNAAFGSDASQIRHRYTDRDGSLSDDPTDTVIVTAHAQVGRSHAAVSVDMKPKLDPLPILFYGVTATDDLELQNGGTLSVELPVQVADDCETATTGVLSTERLECSGNVAITLRGDLAAADLDLPTHDVVDLYGDDAESIAVFALPFANGMREIRNQVITPSNNPFGTPKSNGVYAIDARGASIRVVNSRINATLVISNCPFISVESAVCWDYPTDPGAILVTDAQVEFINLNTNLSELTSATNFNPVLAPYFGIADTDQTDLYPTQFGGLIYSTNTITFQATNDLQRVLVKGGIVCTDLRIHCDVSVHSMNDLIESPPVPLADLQPMQFINGTHRRVTLP